MTSLELKIFASHPVQYHAPLFRELVATGLRIEVGYYHQGAAGRISRDSEFGIDFEWDINLLNGYQYRIFCTKPASYNPAEQIKVAHRFLPWALRDRNTPLLLVGWFAEIVWLAWLLRLLNRAPTMVLSETTPLSFKVSPKPRWRVSLLRWLLRHTSACLFIGTRNRAFLSSMDVPNERLFHTPYSIDNAYFAAESLRLFPHRAELCRQHGLDPELPVFLFCGKLIPKKRPLQLLQAYLAADLKNRAQLLYVGEGGLRPEIESRARDAGAKQVHLLGFLNQTQMSLAYVLGEVLCLISEPTETWGLVVNEALVCGRPVIVSETCGCTPDLVRPENGWTIQLDDLEGLTRTLSKALEYQGDWPIMGQAGRRMVAGHTFKAMAAGVKTALSEIMGKRC